MALYNYFEKAPGALPNPNGPLTDRKPSEAISSANREVSGLVFQDNTVQISKTKTTRGPYTSFSADEKARIAKRPAEFGVTNTLRYFEIFFSWPIHHIAKILFAKCVFAVDSRNTV